MMHGIKSAYVDKRPKLKLNVLVNENEGMWVSMETSSCVLEDDANEIV